MTEVGTQSRNALHAAVSVADRAGYAVAGARVLADSNHTIVWLRPHQILAKVGRPSTEHLLLREHRVARALGELGAPVVPPLSGVEPTRDPDTALLVTLWPRVEHLGEDSADAADVGQSLREVHRALDRYDGELPSFLDKLEDARALLGDDARMSALDPDNRRWLRGAFDALFDELRSRRYAVRGLHGEAHGQNRLTTRGGVRWIDFEGACLGPVEWDLAFLSDASLAAYPPPDEALVQLLRTLNSARIATLCWARYDVPALRWHARFHLQQLRRHLV